MSSLETDRNNMTEIMTCSKELRTHRLLLRSLRDTDIPRIVLLAGAREIAATTGMIPHPYHESDARSYLALAAKTHRESSGEVFAICSLAHPDELRGCIALHFHKPQLHAELGYWVGVP